MSVNDVKELLKMHGVNLSVYEKREILKCIVSLEKQLQTTIQIANTRQDEIREIKKNIQNFVNSSKIPEIINDCLDDLEDSENWYNEGKMLREYIVALLLKNENKIFQNK
jgi:hypothetical protein